MMGDRVSSGRTSVERTSDREVLVTRIFDAPVRLVFDAWSKPELFKLWWPPASGVPLVACEMDVRTGGGYRLTFAVTPTQTMDFFGKYLEVVPLARMVWTNEEGGPDGSVTTITFEDEGGKTRVQLQERYPTKEAFEESFIGMEDALPAQFEQLDELLLTRAANA